MSLDRFIQLWMHPEYPPRPISGDELREVEARFDFMFPADYRDAVLRCGLVSPTIDLLDAIVDRELDMADLSEMLDAEAMIETTTVWREMGLANDMIAFATDCGGSLFCFSTDQNALGVFYFDHDFGATDLRAPSFSSWIDAFCSLAPH